MSTSIRTIPLGIANTFIIKDRGTVLVDCGSPKKANAFIRNLQTAGINPEDIQLIIITHGHWDHIGSTAEIKELTGARVAMHDREKDRLEKLTQPPLKGVGAWGKFLSKSMAAVMTPFIRPFRWSRILITYVIPAIPVCTLWDGLVSVLRTYSVEEMEEMAATLQSGDSFTWEIGEKTSGSVSILYLLGYPNES